MNLQGIRSKAIGIAKKAGQSFENIFPGSTMKVDNSKDPTSAYSMARRKALNSAKTSPSTNLTKASANKVIR